MDPGDELRWEEGDEAMSWTHLSDTTPVGRKDYQCELCYGTIPKGERHVCRSGVSDGDLTTFRMHGECNQVTIDNKWDQDSWEHLDDSSFRDELADWRAAKAKVAQ